LKKPFLHRLEKLESVESTDFEYAESLIKDHIEINVGAYILSEGDTQKKIFFVLQGWGITYKSLKDGGRQILNFVLPGDIIGLFSPIYQMV
jgi:CRP-like cAMP-binding protein